MLVAGGNRDGQRPRLYKHDFWEVITLCDVLAQEVSRQQFAIDAPEEVIQIGTIRQLQDALHGFVRDKIIGPYGALMPKHPVTTEWPPTVVAAQ